MKAKLFITVFISFGILLQSCETEPTNEDKKGILEFKTSNPFATYLDNNPLKSAMVENPPLQGDTTETITTSMKVCIGDIWVSMGEVKAGEPDTLEWIRLTTSTNLEKKLIENYTFDPVELPVGTYRSIKLTLKNTFYRYAKLVSDPTVSYELFETMGSWTDACDENDTTWANTNFFGPDGNHYMSEDSKFELVSEGEKIAGFDVMENKTVFVTWRWGAGASAPCTTYLIDENGNRVWDCGIDRMDFVCPPDALYMADFVIEYEE